MTTLIVEDGSSVPNANTYIDVDYLYAYASQRGYAIPTKVETRIHFLLRAMDYLEYFGDSFAGFQVDSNQSLQWPRKRAYINGACLKESVIPEGLKRAQAQLVVEQQMRTPLFPKPITSTTEGVVIEKTMGPLKKRFSGSSAGFNRLANPLQPIQIASVLVWLRPLFGANTNWKQTIRV